MVRNWLAEWHEALYAAMSTNELAFQLTDLLNRPVELQSLSDQLAEKINSSQSRVAKIEAGATDVSLDLALRAVFALGGELSDVVDGLQASKEEVAAQRTTTKATRTGKTRKQPVRKTV